MKKIPIFCIFLLLLSFGYTAFGYTEYTSSCGTDKKCQVTGTTFFNSNLDESTIQYYGKALYSGRYTNGLNATEQPYIYDFNSDGVSEILVHTLEGVEVFNNYNLERIAYLELTSYSNIVVDDFDNDGIKDIGMLINSGKNFTSYSYDGVTTFTKINNINISSSLGGNNLYCSDDLNGILQTHCISFFSDVSGSGNGFLLYFNSATGNGTTAFTGRTWITPKIIIESDYDFDNDGFNEIIIPYNLGTGNNFFKYDVYNAFTGTTEVSKIINSNNPYYIHPSPAYIGNIDGISSSNKIGAIGIPATANSINSGNAIVLFRVLSGSILKTAKGFKAMTGDISNIISTKAFDDETGESICLFVGNSNKDIIGFSSIEKYYDGILCTSLTHSFSLLANNGNQFFLVNSLNNSNSEFNITNEGMPTYAIKAGEYVNNGIYDFVNGHGVIRIYDENTITYYVPLFPFPISFDFCSLAGVCYAQTKYYNPKFSSGILPYDLNKNGRETFIAQKSPNIWHISDGYVNKGCEDYNCLSEYYFNPCIKGNTVKINNSLDIVLTSNDYESDRIRYNLTLYANSPSSMQKYNTSYIASGTEFIYTGFKLNVSTSSDILLIQINDEENPTQIETIEIPFSVSATMGINYGMSCTETITQEDADEITENEYLTSLGENTTLTQNKLKESLVTISAYSGVPVLLFSLVLILLLDIVIFIYAIQNPIISQHIMTIFAGILFFDLFAFIILTMLGIISSAFIITLIIILLIIGGLYLGYVLNKTKG